MWSCSYFSSHVLYDIVGHVRLYVGSKKYESQHYATYKDKVAKFRLRVSMVWGRKNTTGGETSFGLFWFKFNETSEEKVFQVSDWLRRQIPLISVHGLLTYPTPNYQDCMNVSQYKIRFQLSYTQFQAPRYRVNWICTCSRIPWNTQCCSYPF